MKRVIYFRLLVIFFPIMLFANVALSQGAPTATTEVATSITETTATLNGTVNANLLSTTVYFEYGLTTAYGMTWSGTPAIVTGSSDTAVSATLGELTSGTTYHYRVVATNLSGTTYGSDMTFIAFFNKAITGMATDVNANNATLNSIVYTEGLDTTVVFEYGLTNSYGTTVNALLDIIPGYYISYNDNVVITGLTVATTYHFRVVATNTNGTSYGNDMTFTTSGPEPEATTNFASSVGETTATLNGLVNPNNDSTNVLFEYGTTVAYGSTQNAVQSPLTGTVESSVSTGITGLTINTLYHFRVVATNSFSTEYGEDKLFYTSETGVTESTVTTLNAINVAANNATLVGNVNPHTTFYSFLEFQFGIDTSYGGVIAANPSIISPSNGTQNFIATVDLMLLEPNTTYHYRLVSFEKDVNGDNVYATFYGNDMTFTTLDGSPIPTEPTAETNYASSITTSGAVLNGTVNAQNDSTTVVFEYGPDSNYGITVTANESPVTGSVDTAVTYTLSGLLNNTTYHYRVIATNSTGIAYGEDRTLTTGVTAPSVTTNSATSVGGTSATLNGIVNPNNGSTTVIFEYGLTNDYGRVIAASQSPVIGTTNVAVNINLTALVPNTTYYYRIVGENSSGKTYGSAMSFTTIAAPTVTTNAATSVDATFATLNGTANANGYSSTISFEFGTTTGYGTTVAASQSPISDSSDLPVSTTISGLTVGTTYHYRIIGTNTNGTTYGNDLTFFTSAPNSPTAVTQPATLVIQTGATLHGTVNANNSLTTVTFEYGLTTAYGSSITAETSPVSGVEDTDVSVTISGLTNNTTYHYRVVAVNGQGTANGADVIFDTQSWPVSETTEPTNIGVSSATLNGIGNNNNIGTNYLFEYGTDLSYGTYVDTNPSYLSNSLNTNLTANITGLLQNTVYHYRLVSMFYRVYGFGSPGLDMTFTTGITATTAVTNAATSIGSNSATLNGTVNADNLSTTVTFEYGLTTAYGRTIVADISPLTGNIDTNVSAMPTDLLASSTYHYRVVAQNSLITVYGNDMTLNTNASAPTAITGLATSTTSSTATLNGIVNANNSSTTVTFEYGLTTSYGSSVNVPESPVLGIIPVNVTGAITGLSNNSVYHYRIVAVSAIGTTYGADMTFNTSILAPIATTLPATVISSTGASLNGSVNPNSGDTTVTFEIGLDSSYGLTVNATINPITGNILTPVLAVINSLVSNTTYHYRVVATNSAGTTYGADMIFVTVVNPIVSGTVTDGTNPVQGVTVSFSFDGHTELTAADGTYSYTIPYNTTTTVSASHPSYSGFTPISLSHIFFDTPNQDFSGIINIFQITATTGTGGEVSPTGTMTVNSGTNMTFIFTPSSGYHQGDITVDGVNIGVRGSYTFGNISANHTIYGKFVENIPPVITSFTADDVTGNAQFPVTFQVDAYDPDGGDIVEYRLIVQGTHDFQLVSTSPIINFNFLFAGNYNVTVEVTDDEGETTLSETILINVNEPSAISIPTSKIYAKQRKQQASVFTFKTTLINPFESKGLLTLKAYGESGEILETTTQEINGFAKTVVNTEQFNNVDYTDLVAIFDQYAIVSTEISDSNAEMAAYLKSPLKSYLVVPHIAEETSQWDSYAYLSNEKRALIDFTIGDNYYELSGEQSYFLNLEDYLSENISEGQSWGLVENRYIDPFSNSKKLTGFEMFKKTGADGAAVELLSKGYRTLYIPHIPKETEQFWTGFVFVNKSDTTVDATFTFYKGDGELCGTVNKEIGSQTKLKGTMESLFPEQVGVAEFAVVTSNEKLWGIEIYGTYNAGICGFSLTGQTFSSGVLPYVYSSSETWTGLALANPNAVTANVSFKLVSANGTVKATAAIMINPFNHTAVVLADLFGETVLEQTDYIKFSSTTPVSAVEVSGDLDFAYMKAITGEYINYWFKTPFPNKANIYGGIYEYIETFFYTNNFSINNICC